jgi:hypothetical protein
MYQLIVPRGMRGSDGLAMHKHSAALQLSISMLLRFSPSGSRILLPTRNRAVKFPM